MATQEQTNQLNLQSFVFYESFYQGIKELSPEERLMFYEAIIEFGLYRIEPNFNGIYKSYWIQIRTSILSAKKRYETSVENGKHGGAPEGNKNAYKEHKCSTCRLYRSCDKNCRGITICEDYDDKNKNNQNQPNKNKNNLNDNVNDNVNDKDNVNSIPFSLTLQNEEELDRIFA